MTEVFRKDLYRLRTISYDVFHTYYVYTLVVKMIVILVGLQEALQKMEDYMNEEMTLKDTLKQISQEMEGKIDANSMKLMKDYFG